jgi:hypothetical protein
MLLNAPLALSFSLGYNHQVQPLSLVLYILWEYSDAYEQEPLVQLLTSQYKLPKSDRKSSGSREHRCKY